MTKRTIVALRNIHDSLKKVQEALIEVRSIVNEYRELRK